MDIGLGGRGLFPAAVFMMKWANRRVFMMKCISGDGSRRPAEPREPPRATTAKSGGAPPVVAPRYKPPPPNAAVSAAASPRRVSPSGAPKRASGSGVAKAEKKKRKAEKKKKTSSSSSSDSSEDSPPAAVATGTTGTTTDLAVMARVDDLTSKAISFSRGLTRAQQALRTSARIAREAAVSFESEMENFVQAQRDINVTFNIDH